MQILDNIIIVLMIIISFVSGLKVSDRYHKQAKEDEKYALRKQFARLVAGVDSDDPAQPYVAKRKFAVGQEFMDRLHTNGAATMQFSNQTNPAYPPQAAAVTRRGE